VVQELYAKMQTNYRVATERIYIIGSSGLQKPGQYRTDVDNKDELVRKIQTATGVKMTFIDVDQEAKDSIQETVPDQYLESAILIDVGSGNTKGGFHERGELLPMSIPYGTVSFRDAVMKQTGADKDFAPLAVKLRDELLVPALKKEVERHAPLVTRGRIYMTGGIVWVMANVLHPSNRDANVRIDSEDINKFEKMALTNDPGLKKPDLTGIKDQKVRDEINEAANEFQPDKLIAGAEVLQALSKVFEFANKDIYFRNSSEWGWLFTYVKRQAAGQQTKKD
jgi:Ppx/GppA phosphatase family